MFKIIPRPLSCHNTQMTLMCVAAEAGEEVGREQGENLQIPNRTTRSGEGEPHTRVSGWALARWRGVHRELSQGLAE